MASSCMEALATRRKGRAGGAANVPANGVTETNQTAASFRHTAIGGLSVASSVGHPNERNPMNAAFVAIKPQKPKLARALEKRQVHAELQKAKNLKRMGERGCQTVAPYRRPLRATSKGSGGISAPTFHMHSVLHWDEALQY
ncbi:hypothetical protein, unlikely [Trypanosoma congolense IL3000]|uniref:Uncharacterized protein n=1 Tax=Trypanosoma congolense (strain IL3000) TaxID=1068625 RepID=F9W9N4_TRYCI|nr:hypothetical protein, unlikely [Trypanosoma congolense IL3000]